MKLIADYKNGIPTHLITWLYAACFIVFAMVVIGGITRLTGSGLSITEWKVVTGTFPPLTLQAWEGEFARYKQTPQYIGINPHFNLDDFKNIYWWEYLHRLVGRMLGFVFLGGSAWFYFKNQISRTLAPKLIVMFLLGAWQGFLGWYMVLSGLVGGASVSHYRLAIHLINAFLTFGYIFWVAQNLQCENRPASNKSTPTIRRLAVITMALLALQIIYGAFVAGTHAGHAYNTWPMMNDRWMADAVPMGWDEMGFMSLFENLATIQFIHRTIGLLLLVMAAFIWCNRKSEKWKLNRQQLIATNLLLVFSIAQFILGVITLLVDDVRITMGVIHQAGAFALFASLVHLLNRLYAKRS